MTKKPEKKPEKKPTMIEVEVRGHTFRIDERAKRDYRIFDAIVAAERGDVKPMLYVADIMLGADKQAAMDLVADEDGYVDAAEMGSLLRELFQGLVPNSQGSPTS